MGALLFSLLAACCAALSSLCLRKNLDGADGSGSPTGYLILFYLSAFLLSIGCYPEIWSVRFHPTMFCIGALVGVLNSTLMLMSFRALRRGPAGLTFAFQNASAVFPGLILFMFLGSDFGFSCSLVQAAGMLLVLCGLFWGAQIYTLRAFKWLKYAVGCFIVQILALTFTQARCVLFDVDPAGEGLLTYLALSAADDAWFMPGLFGASLGMQILLFLRESHRLKRRECIYGSLGGLANFSSTCLLMLATKLALPFEKAILFPCFSVAALILCNTWANRLYGEKFNFKTNSLCSLGIFLAASG